MDGSALGIYMIDLWAQDDMKCYEQSMGASLSTKQAPFQVAAAAIPPSSSAESAPASAEPAPAGLAWLCPNH
jgi:hypothetical protein